MRNKAASGRLGDGPLTYDSIRTWTMIFSQKNLESSLIERRLAYWSGESVWSDHIWGTRGATSDQLKLLQSHKIGRE